MIWELDGIAPQIADDAWVAPDAQLMGRIVLEPGASVWFGAVLRGDNEEIRVGRNSNVQDLTVCHTDIGYPLSIGANCTIGHRAILHGCTIEDGALIGMGAIILNGARIGAGSLIGAGALIAENKVIPPGSLVMGAPGKVVRELDEAARARLLQSAEGYHRNAVRFRQGLAQVARG
ncbi:gamma carbonic anhydrase family protein [Paracoccus sp. P2]|uniref:Gamma carbonic anhydrase family protein n=1 Tax=Paracoccus pantotrophus TaxID=82367 RepID=A0A7H9BQU7_PARPN|nr:gamma carbonic anhydrase family protein [Paracoccus pantotrophus]MDF3854329.1 gamma carbonic anhydrase family protein [Paracoccus pantotrophus]QLH13737.1 gamma carbonic anhydrase family protein [Paracoccus pantotrophus]RDE00889.1 gamma carbonic anhydrase family protein [Paracoccus pantotrophus]RNI17618.1 gamma carbonic anhydrase family protein [Paracoccus pantotrophus]WGR67104.1 gamma carbonic anhydrase family protein [Paracoccus pantotrophus]